MATVGYEEALTRITGLVSASETTKQYTFMRMASSGYYAVCGDGTAADAVLQDNPSTTGYVGELAISGVSKVIVGSNGVTCGHTVTADSTGAARDTSATSDVVNGRALVTGVVGDIVPVLLKCQH